MNLSLRLKLLTLSQRALTVMADAQPTNGDKWITTEGGSRVLLDKNGIVKGGMGGKFTGQNIKDTGGTKKFTKYQTNEEREQAKQAKPEAKQKKEKTVSPKKQLENKIWGEIDGLTANNDPDSHDYMTGRFLKVMANNGMKNHSHEEDLMRHELDRTKGTEKTSKAYQRAIKILKETKETHKKEHAKPVILAEHKQLNDAAGNYGYSIAENGEISSSKGSTGVTVSKKGDRLLYKDANDNLVFSTSPDESGVSAFLKGSYGAEAKQPSPEAKPEKSIADKHEQTANELAKQKTEWSSGSFGDNLASARNLVKKAHEQYSKQSIKLNPELSIKDVKEGDVISFPRDGIKGGFNGIVKKIYRTKMDIETEYMGEPMLLEKLGFMKNGVLKRGNDLIFADKDKFNQMKVERGKVGIDTDNSTNEQAKQPAPEAKPTSKA